MDELQMIQRIDAAKVRVSQILDRTKHPVIASGVDHSYDDKYLLAEFLVNTALASQLTTLRYLGLGDDHMATIHGCVDSWSTTLNSVSVRFSAEEKCTFLRTETREEDSKTKTVVEGGLFSSPATHKVVTTIKEWVWEFEASWEILCVKGAGTDPSQLLRILGRKGKHMIRTTTDRPPRPSMKSPAASFDLNLSFLLASTKTGVGTNAANSPLSPSFKIDREHVACLTPRRNPDVDRALEWASQFQVWAGRVKHYVTQELVETLDPVTKGSLDLHAARDTSSIFVPVLPLFLENSGVEEFDSLAAVTSLGSDGGAAADQGEAESEYASLPPAIAGAEASSKKLLGVQEVNAFLGEESRGLAEKRSSLAASFPPPHDGGALVSAAEAMLWAICAHLQRVCFALDEGLGFVETMLRSQLRAAIGHEVNPSDFAAYMSFHYRRHLFQGSCAPQPFCHSVRRTPAHSPEGTVSIEFSPSAGGDGGGGSDTATPPRPIETMSCLRPLDNSSSSSSEGGQPPTGQPPTMGFSINSATRVNFSGDRHLHAWLRFDFAGDDGTSTSSSSSSSASLVCRARQFSSFVVLVGRLVDATTLDPVAAVVVQNRDELSVPLSLATLPTPKAFKDAIVSLSPEQQRFAKAFRQLQLNSTLFGVCVVQVKPQLEAVLNLPPDSLTKEIKLTQDLMELFVDYQISADLLSFDATDAAGGAPSGPGSGGQVGAGQGSDLLGGASSGGGGSVAAKLAAVKAHVAAMKEMIGATKDEELAAKRQEHLYAHPAADMLSSAQGYGAPQPQQESFADPFSMMDVQSEGMGGAGCFGGCGNSARGNSFRGGGGGGGGSRMMMRKSRNAAPMNRMQSAALAGGLPPPPPPAPPQPAPAPAAASASALATPPPTAAAAAAPSPPKQASPSAAEELALATQEEKEKKKKREAEEGGGAVDDDLTKVAVDMDSRYDALDSSAALRPTIITPGSTWHKKAFAALLAAKKPPTSTSLGPDEQASEKAKAFDLLDALSRSGALPLRHTELHVVVCATQAFDDSVVDTVVCKNVNPIERAERSALIMAAAVRGLPPRGAQGYASLVKASDVERVAELSPVLFHDGPLPDDAAAAAVIAAVNSPSLAAGGAGEEG